MPHFLMGMIKTFTVTTAANGTPTGTPTADGVVKLVNFSFEMPPTIKQGALLEVINQGTQPHELTIVKPASGKTKQDVITAVTQHGAEAPQPYLPEGGVSALAPEMSGWVKLNLAPGQYVAVCFVPDSATGKAHSMLGMQTSFTVQA